MALNLNGLPFEKKFLHSPPLSEIAPILEKGMKQNFKEVEVSVVTCPNLCDEPFNLVSPGLGGNKKIVDIGGPPYLLPLVQRQKIYDLKGFPKLFGMSNMTIIGAGAAPFPYLGVNGEGIYNLKIENGNVTQRTVVSKILKPSGEVKQEILPDSETRLALLGNLYISEGRPGKVLKVVAKKRKGAFDFVTSMRTSLKFHYKDQPVGLGGTFVLKSGKAKQHVMDDFSHTPLLTDDDLNKWLYFFEMKAPLVAVGTLVTSHMDMDLRVQHFHSFGETESGHYHIDTTPEEVEYEGYFAAAEAVIRIDKPMETHNIGRD